MASDADGSRGPLARLADGLAQAVGGARPTPLELAELLWLARRLEPPPEEPPGPPARPAPDAADVQREEPPEPPRPEPPAPAPPAAPTAPAPPPALPRQPRVPLHLPAHGPGAGRPHTALRAPAPPMLRHPLALQRALRPLKLRTDAPAGHRLDERATADRIARLGAAPEWWLPVLGPARERWLRLNVVHDTGPTMPVWRPLVRELHTALAQSGVFRTVTPARLEPDGTVRGAYAPADGRTVTLVISDCMGPQWRPGPAGARWEATLRRWSHRLPVAVVQPLPEHLWRDTALPAEPGLLTAPGPAAPTAALAFAPYDADPAPYARRGAVPLPVLEPDPGWLASWAGLVASPGGSAFPGSAALLGRPLDPAARTDLARLSPEELVLRFRATSSREAFRLAGHLALGRADLPVMRLVQRAVEPAPRPQHLAEVILSGLLTTAPGPPGSYAFRPGVRDLLLRSLPRSSRAATAGLLDRVGALIEERAGSAPGEFRAVTPAAGGPESAPADGAAFATVRPDSVRRLGGGRTAPAEPDGGRYRLLERVTEHGRVWRAEDRTAGRTVAMRLLGTVLDPQRPEAVVRAANRLKELRHPNVVTVLDTGVTDGTPFMVMEYLDGIPLNALAAPGGYRLPAPLVVSVGAQLARALAALHTAGVAHGGLGMARVLLLPDGQVKLTHAEPGRSAGPQGRAGDLHALAELMLLLAAGTARVPRPLTADRLRHLPPPLREHYAHALGLLTSSSPADRERGRALLDDAEQRTAALGTYDRRRYRLLGPVTVRSAGAEQPLDASGRAVLAMLLLGNGRATTHQELRAGLWGPADARHDGADLERAVAQVAAAVGPGALARLPAGYALHTSADSVDLRDCADLQGTAEALAARGEPARAREHLETALALWYGEEPLSGVPGPAARAARPRLSQLRHTLCRRRAELDLELGEYDRAARNLTALLHSHPAREDYRRLLLIALRELGRLEEALEVFEEYELTGGTNPELLALGHELRRDHADSQDAGGPRRATDAGPAATDPYPNDLGEEGPFPTEDDLPSLLFDPDDSPREAPLPQNEVPESLFADEPPAPAPPPSRVAALFEYAGGPREADDLPALGRAVTRLLTGGRLSPDDYRMRARDDGYAVLLRPGAPVLPLLGATLRELADRVAETGRARWRVTFLAGDDKEGAWPPPEDLVDDVLTANAAQGIAVLSPSLHRELLASGYDGPAPQALPGADGRYVLARAPRPGTAGPVHGPFLLPLGLPLPQPAGHTRSVVYATSPGLTLARDRRATFYYEVDLTDRRLPLEESGPPVDGAPVFRATGTAVWRVTDPVGAVRAGAERDISGLVTGHLRDCLREVSLAYPPGYARQAQAALDTQLGRLSPAWSAVGWRVALTPVAARRTPPRPSPGERRLAGALGAARAVILGLDGTLTRFGTEWGDLAHRHRGGRAARPEDPLDLLRPAVRRSASAVSLEAELAALERAAAQRATPVPHADLLVRTLAAKGVPLAVVTDRDRQAAVAYLRRRGLLDCLPGRVHGRDGVGGRLMPVPRALLEAAQRLGAGRRDCLVIGSSDVEREAARSAGMVFVHVGAAPQDVFAPDLFTCEELLPLLRAARTL
ncbi:SAV_2336 N-terminal domain-related protein [Streptomyces sp. NPDC013313]|uniref:SAV_2336 N-terminal domain-related protein n=1 Tax=Streptomyces sp. NPDC013313 TaxID=3155603 RepID=UPI0033C344EA